jgi:hypothetical protein
MAATNREPEASAKGDTLTSWVGALHTSTKIIAA